MNFEKTLEIVKHKVDTLMERIDPCMEKSEGGYIINKRYSQPERFEDFYTPMHWTHSFLTGMVALMYYHFKEEKYLNYLIAQKEKYKKYAKGDGFMVAHDAGFLYSLYAVALYKLTGDEEAREIALTAADQLGKRFRFRAGVMEAFGNVYEENYNNGKVLIIVDDMMNMPLLMWAYRETGHTFYKQVYELHIENALKYLVRNDYSLCHAYHIDDTTGRPISEMNYCGYGIGSHWARGTAWVIYGLAKAVQCVDDGSRYKYLLEGIVQKYINELGENPIPEWDFRLPVYEEKFPDTSAAAVAGSIFNDFSRLGIDVNIEKKAMELSDSIFALLSGKNYFLDDDSEAIIDKSQCGKNCVGSLWGDYFYTELLMKKLHSDLPDFWI